MRSASSRRTPGGRSCSPAPSRLTTLGLIFGPFIIIIGFFCLMIAVSGFVLEYYYGINRTQAETLSTVLATGNLPTSDNKFLGEQHH